jgi:sortase (surface protein transpeptidase)
MRSGPSVRAPVAAALAVVGVALVATGLAVPPARSAAPPAAPHQRIDATPTVTLAPTPRPRPSPTERAAPTTQADLRDRVRGPVQPESDPVVVSIPRIGVRSTLVGLGLTADGAMEVPGDPARAGWFTRGPAPGALGPAVIAGHVTWNGTPGVFYRLGKLRRGDRIVVTREDGTAAVFVVDEVARYAKARFPVRTVYGAIDHAGLRLITCGGTYDSTRYRYPDNVVVFARLDSVRT